MSDCNCQPLSRPEQARAALVVAHTLREELASGRLNYDELGSSAGIYEVDAEGYGFQFHWFFDEEVLQVEVPFRNGCVLVHINRDFVPVSVEFIAFFSENPDYTPQ